MVTKKNKDVVKKTKKVAKGTMSKAKTAAKKTAKKATKVAKTTANKVQKTAKKLKAGIKNVVDGGVDGSSVKFKVSGDVKLLLKQHVGKPCVPCVKKGDKVQVGTLVAKRAIEKGIETVVYDRGGYIYHGVVKELAEAAREAGLKF